MNIEAEKFNIQMTYGELWSLAFDVKSALMHTVNTHWINHPEAWRSHEEDRQARLRNMFRGLGRPELYDHTIAEIEAILKPKTA